MADPLQLLQQYWGYKSFRPLQREIIEAALANKDTLALLPTSGGKSICYQLPALALDGFCLVISPLIALMQDQVARLKEHGIPAECIYSGMRYTDVKQVLQNMLHGPYKLLYVSPERLQTDLFQEYMPEFNISLFAVDEAHCISQWGHDFRPDYLRIKELRQLFTKVPVLALTASATPEVQTDIITQLQLSQPAIFKDSFQRKNIFYHVRYSEQKTADTIQNTSAECAIIYCRSRKQTEALTKNLNDSGRPALCYHAGMAKDRRGQAQQSWMHNHIPVMVATTAFGMGIDKPDVRMVVHYDAPEHLEAYYQEAGRAGRDGLAARALALYNSADIIRLKDSTKLHFPHEAYLRQVYQAVVEYLQIPIGAQPDQYYPFDLADFSKKFSLQATHASHALRLLAQEGLWTMTEAVFQPATIRFTTNRQTLDHINTAYPNLSYIITALLRAYSGIFQYPATVRLSALAKQLKLKQDEIEHCILQLQQMEVLEYHKPSEGPQLFFHHYRVDSRHLLINMQRIGILRKRHEARTEAVIAFLENTAECREKLLLTYFGEQPGNDCMHCDVCERKYQQVSHNHLAEQVTNLLHEKGPIPARHIGTYFAETIREQAIALIRRMIDNGQLLLQPDGKISAKKK